MSSPVSYDLQGQGGGVAIEGGNNLVTGNFRWIQVLVDAEFSTLTSSNITEADSKIVGKTIPAGVGIGGRFSSIEFGTGLVIAYYA